MWAVGEDGAIIFSRNGGWETIDQSVSLDGTLYDVNFVDTSFGWAIGLQYPAPFSGKIFSTTNGGEEWMDQSEGQDWHRLQAVKFIDRQCGWACGDSGTVLRTTTGGGSWQLESIGDATMQLNDIEFINGQLGWLAGRRKLYKTTDGGVNWRVVSDIGGTSIFMLDSLNGWIGGFLVGMQNVLRRTTDGGLTWNIQYQPLSELTIQRIAFMDSLSGWCALWDNRQDPPPGSHPISMVHTTDGGNSWFEQYMGVDAINGLSFDERGHGCAVGPLRIMYSSNSGVNWIRRNSGTSEDLLAIEVVDTANSWAVGNEGTVLHTSDGGVV